MPQPNDLSRSLVALDQNSTIIAVVELSHSLGGEIKYLSQGEIEARNRGYSPYSIETWRTWEYWANRAGCGDLLTRPDAPRAD